MAGELAPQPRRKVRLPTRPKFTMLLARFAQTPKPTIRFVRPSLRHVRGTVTCAIPKFKVLEQLRGK